MITPRRLPRNSLYVRVDSANMFDHTDIMFIHYIDGQRHVARIIPGEVDGDYPHMPHTQWELVPEGTVSPPTLRLPREAFMALCDGVLDHLESLGLLDRAAPERYKAELNATMRHLHDLRMISFQALGVEESEPMIVKKASDGTN